MKRPLYTSTTEWRDAVLDAWHNLRRIRNAVAAKGMIAGGGLAEAEATYDTLARQYAVHRITKGLGPDPQALDRETFSDALFDMAARGKFAKHLQDSQPSRLARDTMAALLASGTDLSRLLKAVKAASPARDAFDPRTPVKELMREWAEQTAEDPFVEQCLCDIASHAAAFRRAVADTDALLNQLRMTYELEHDGAEVVAFRRGERGGLELVAVTGWETLTAACRKEAGEVYAALAGAEVAVTRMDRIAKDLNRELARFFAELIPRQFGLLSALPRGRRRELTGGIGLTPALAAKLAEAAATTDFLADPSGKLGVERQAIPRRFRPLVVQRAYQQVRDSVVGHRAHNDTTVVVRRAGPAPASEDA